jgi:hypothetical protein
VPFAFFVRKLSFHTKATKPSKPIVEEAGTQLSRGYTVRMIKAANVDWLDQAENLRVDPLT